MIIGISGKIGSGKDTVGKIIQYLVCKEQKAYDGTLVNPTLTYEQFLEPNRSFHKEWQIKKFADTLKDITCLLIGCTREQLEDIEFKNKPLGEEWWFYSYDVGGRKLYSYLEYKDNKDYTTFLTKLTPRLVMQLLGTECGRQIIHPNIWVNALMSKYSVDTKIIWTKKIDDLHLMKNSSTYCGKPMLGNNYANTYKYLDTEVYERPIRTSCKECEKLALPNWIITDMRFPNELKAVEDKGGISIRVDRPLFNLSGSMLHESEIALDNAEFKYTINNDGTIEELIESVRQILIKENLI